MRPFIGLVLGVTAEKTASIPESEVWLAFVIYGYKLGGYILRMNGADMEIGCIKGGGDRSKGLQRIFGTDSFDASAKDENRFVMVRRSAGEWNKL